MKCKECGQDIGQYELYSLKGILIASSPSESILIRLTKVTAHIDTYIYDNVTENGYHVRLEIP